MRKAGALTQRRRHVALVDVVIGARYDAGVVVAFGVDPHVPDPGERRGVGFHEVLVDRADRERAFEELAEHVVTDPADQVGRQPGGRDAHRDVEALAAGAQFEPFSDVVGTGDPAVRLVGDEVGVQAADDTHRGTVMRAEVDDRDRLHRCTRASHHASPAAKASALGT